MLFNVTLYRKTFFKNPKYTCSGIKNIKVTQCYHRKRCKIVQV
jgi:hypothetical protein